ncbi:MAG: serine hydrolase domain-containing protein [Bryobacterales bacterium]
MQFAEIGMLDLDAPVTTYLPDFGKQITLRQLMAHRSGLVREPPVGNYFDPTEPTIEQVVTSLKDTPQVLEPGSKTKYSNAGLMTVGRVVEVLARKPFHEHMQTEVLERLGMLDSSFQREERLGPRIPLALMWSYDGREFPAPTFDVLEPAGNLYSRCATRRSCCRRSFATARRFCSRRRLLRCWSRSSRTMPDSGSALPFRSSRDAG